MRIQIKPLSANSAWKGRRFRTDAYKAFEREFSLKLKPMKVPASPLKIAFEFGFSNKLADADNAIKQTLDTLCKKYGFNDRDVYEMHIRKVIVPKGEEYIDFEITSLQTPPTV